MSTRKPKDLMLAEVAYNTFYEEQPQVFFDDLAPAYQMRWVRAIRSVVADYRRLKAPPANGGGSQPVRTKVSAKAVKASKAGKASSNGVDPDRLKMWNAQDEKDIAEFTDKRWTEKSKSEVQARQRLAYRNKQRERYGLEIQHTAN